MLDIAISSRKADRNNCDEIAAEIIEEQASLHLKHRNTSCVWPEGLPYSTNKNETSSNSISSSTPSSGVLTQREKIMLGEQFVVFYLEIAEN